MCVILVGPNVKELLSLPLEKAWDINNDGAGFAYRETKTKRVVCIKGIMSYQGLIDALSSEKIPEHNSVVLHMRVATHGKVKPGFTHPFTVEKGKSYFFHNGIVSEFGKAGEDGYPDSMHIAYILSCLDPEDRAPVLRNTC